MSAVAEVKETKAQRAERLKREHNPWECLDEIRRFAREGWDSIPPEWLSSYFRWWGLYTQGDGVGVTGGKGGEGRMEPYFMVRVRIPNGQLFSHQLRAIADLADRYARGVADITVRQNIQLHWVEVQSLPDLLETLWRHNLNTIGACGDVTRNVTGCPLAGYAADELVDASGLVHAIDRMLAGNPEYYNLPRKYKITATGCSAWCNYPEINDIGLVARRQGHDVGYGVMVGGGLSTQPHLAVPLPIFVEEHQVLPVVRAITDIFRDSDVLRENRERARLKYLFLKNGWTAEMFLDEIERRLGYTLQRADLPVPPEDVYRDHVGIHPQRQPGLSSVGAGVIRGRITPEQMRTAARLSDEYGSGEIACTIMQNLLLPNVRSENTQRVAGEMTAAGLPVEASVFWRGAIACTGTEFCKLAISETKQFSLWLVEEMQHRLPEFDQELKIHVTGCPNSCGQHWIADIGLEGKKIKHEGEMVDAFYFFVGGALGMHAGFGRKTGFRSPATLVPDALENLLRSYLQRRTAGENLRHFFARHTEDELRAFLEGVHAAAAA